MRRSNFIYPHTDASVRLALALAAWSAVDELAHAETEPMEVTC